MLHLLSLIAIFASGCSTAIEVEPSSASGGGEGSSGAGASSPGSSGSGPELPATPWSKAFATLVPIGLAADSEGNVLFAADGWGEIDLGAGPVAGHVFVVKLDPSGNLLWSVGFASNQQDNVTGFGVDASGNVTLAGFTNGATIDFGGGPLAGAKPATGHLDGFLVRLDADGHHVWSKRIKSTGGAGADAYFATGTLGVDPAGGVVLSGAFAGTIDIDGAAVAPGPQGP
jgi:hypothetical protein